MRQASPSARKKPKCVAARTAARSSQRKRLDGKTKDGERKQLRGKISL